MRLVLTTTGPVLFLIISKLSKIGPNIFAALADLPGTIYSDLNLTVMFETGAVRSSLMLFPIQEELVQSYLELISLF